MRIRHNNIYGAVLLLAASAFVSCADFDQLQKKSEAQEQTWTISVEAGKQNNPATRALQLDDGGDLKSKWDGTEAFDVIKDGEDIGDVTAAASSTGNTILTGTITTTTLAEEDELTLRPKLNPDYKGQDGTLAGISSKDFVGEANVTIDMMDSEKNILKTSSATFHRQQSFTKFTFSESLKFVKISAPNLVGSPLVINAAEPTTEFLVAMHNTNSSTAETYYFIGTKSDGSDYTGTKSAKIADDNYYEADVTLTAAASKSFIVNGVPFRMMPVAGGNYTTMGGTAGVTGRLTDYYIGETEVTQEQWEAVTGSNPSYFTGSSLLPVENVSYTDITEENGFLDQLNAATASQRVNVKFKLPTEAQWEWAARGGASSNGYTYSGSNTIGDVAWYASNSGGQTHEVGTKAPNELGLYDMTGNVWEWCSDKSANTKATTQGVNYLGPIFGSDGFVKRGGHYNDSDNDILKLTSTRGNLNNTSSILGLRLAMVIVAPSNISTMNQLRDNVNLGYDCSEYLGYFVDASGNIASSMAEGNRKGIIAYMSPNVADSSFPDSRVLIIAKSDASNGCHFATSNASIGSAYQDVNAMNGYAFTSTHTSTSYPAARAAWLYDGNAGGTAVITGGSGWFLPSEGQMASIYQRGIGRSNPETMHSVTNMYMNSGSGATGDYNNFYWLATEHPNYTSCAMNFYAPQGSFVANTQKASYDLPVRAIFAYPGVDLGVALSNSSVAPGWIITSDAKAYAPSWPIPSSKTKAAVVVYKSGSTRYAVSLTDMSSQMDWNHVTGGTDNNSINLSHSPSVSGYNWKCGTKAQYVAMFGDGNATQWQTFNKYITDAGGNALVTGSSGAFYVSTTKRDSGSNWIFYNGGWNSHLFNDPDWVRPMFQF